MGRVAEAEELAGSDELDELYRLDASETGPQDDDKGDKDKDKDEDDKDEDIQPDEMPQG